LPSQASAKQAQQLQHHQLHAWRDITTTLQVTPAYLVKKVAPSAKIEQHAINAWQAATSMKLSLLMCQKPQILYQYSARYAKLGTVRFVHLHYQLFAKPANLDFSITKLQSNVSSAFPTVTAALYLKYALSAPLTTLGSQAQYPLNQVNANPAHQTANNVIIQASVTNVTQNSTLMLIDFASHAQLTVNTASIAHTVGSA